MELEISGKESTERYMASVPKRRFYHETMVSVLMHLVEGAERQNRLLDEQGWTGRRVLGFKLPSWQRDFCWTDAQCADFIESVYLGANIGHFMANSSLKDEFDLILLDGQQRLRAIERYVAGEIAVPGEDGVLSTWLDLSDDERRHFHRMGFPWLCTQYASEAVLREAYNRHNFSGTPHQPDERAEPGDFRSSKPGFHGP